MQLRGWYGEFRSSLTCCYGLALVSLQVNRLKGPSLQVGTFVERSATAPIHEGAATLSAAALNSAKGSRSRHGSVSRAVSKPLAAGARVSARRAVGPLRLRLDCDFCKDRVSPTIIQVGMVLLRGAPLQPTIRMPPSTA
jgi:hypothetical protein